MTSRLSLAMIDLVRAGHRGTRGHHVRQLAETGFEFVTGNAIF